MVKIFATEMVGDQRRFDHHIRLNYPSRSRVDHFADSLLDDPYALFVGRVRSLTDRNLPYSRSLAAVLFQ
jgi:hypothetical protein